MNNPIRTRIIQLGNSMTTNMVEQGPLACVCIIRHCDLLNPNGSSIQTLTTNSHSILPCFKAHPQQPSDTSTWTWYPARWIPSTTLKQVCSPTLYEGLSKHQNIATPKRMKCAWMPIVVSRKESHQSTLEHDVFYGNDHHFQCVVCNVQVMCQWCVVSLLLIWQNSETRGSYGEPDLWAYCWH